MSNLVAEQIEAARLQAMRQSDRDHRLNDLNEWLLSHIKWPVRSFVQKYAPKLYWWWFDVKHRRLNRIIATQKIGQIAKQRALLERETETLKRLEADRADSRHRGAGLLFAA